MQIVHGFYRSELTERDDQIEEEPRNREQAGIVEQRHARPLGDGHESARRRQGHYDPRPVNKGFRAPFTFHIFGDWARKREVDGWPRGKRFYNSRRAA